MPPIKDNIRDALNEQVKWELYSGYMYLSMATWFYDQNLPGFAKFFRAHAKEEQEHAIKIFDYIIERGGRVTLQTIDQPPSEWNSPLGVLEEVYKHEVKVTGMINELMSLAKSENDYATEEFLWWFVDEQVEEEDSADEVYQQLKRAGESGQTLIMMDRALARRGD
ncbi:MAG: ferritin [Candidatus Sifarchaeia archaeon]|jgi:ferritin